MLKQRFRVGDVELPERRKTYTNSLEGEHVATDMCRCGTAIESRVHMVEECEVYKKERGTLDKEMSKSDKCGMEEFGRLEGTEKPIHIIGDKWWPQTAKQEGGRISEQFLCNIHTEKAK